MTIGESKAAENMRRRRFYAAAMSVNALIWSAILAGLAYVGLIGPQRGLWHGRKLSSARCSRVG